MVGSPGQNRNEGMSGFDWVTYKDLQSQLGDANGVYADLLLPAFDEGPNIPIPETALDRYENVEGVSGGIGNDTLRGTNVTAADMPAEGARGSVLMAGDIPMIAGLNLLLGNGVLTAQGNFDGGNIMLGGVGSDLFEGRGGDDIIHGDRWLNVRVQWNNPNGPTESFTSIAPMIPRVLTGEIQPEHLQIVREIIAPTPQEIVSNIDTAAYIGAQADYTVQALGGGAWRVTDNVGDEGVDTLYGIEQIRFGDGVNVPFDFRVLSNAPIGGPTITETTPNGTPVTPTQSQQLTALAILGPGGDIDDIDGIAANPNTAFLWQQSTNGGASWAAIAARRRRPSRPARARSATSSGCGCSSTTPTEPAIRCSPPPPRRSARCSAAPARPTASAAPPARTWRSAAAVTTR
jgi:hypothetical protein